MKNQLDFIKKGLLLILFTSIFAFQAYGISCGAGKCGMGKCGGGKSEKMIVEECEEQDENGECIEDINTTKGEKI